MNWEFCEPFLHSRRSACRYLKDRTGSMDFGVRYSEMSHLRGHQTVHCFPGANNIADIVTDLSGARENQRHQ